MKILEAGKTTGQVKIFLDDRDVSNLCFYAEAPDSAGINGEGKVMMYVGKKVGKVITIDVDDAGDPVVVEKTGMVRWELML